MTTLITSVDQAKKAGAYDAQYGAGSYAGITQPTTVSPTVNPTVSTTVNPTYKAPTNSIDAYINANPAPGTYVQPSTTTVNAADIGKTTPLSVPTTNGISTTANGISGAADTALETHNTILDQLKAEQDARQKAADESTASLKDTMQKILGVQSSRDQVESDLHVNDLAKLNNDNFTALQASKRAQENEIKALQQNGSVTQEQAQAQISEVNRKYAFEQADLSIALDVSNRNYSAAQATADKKIQMQLEPLQTLLGFQEKFYEQNQDQLSKAQQNRLQVLIDDNKTQLAYQHEELTAVSQIQIEAAKNGAPTSVVTAIGKAKDRTSAAALAGQYMSDPLDRQYKQAQINELNRKNINSEAPTIKSINGVDMQWNPKTRTWDKATIGSSVTDNSFNPATEALVQKKNLVDSLLTEIDNKNGFTRANAVGPNKFTRLSPFSAFTGAKGDFIAGTQQLISKDTLDQLINLKKAGGTLGALSEKEGQMLKESASKIGSWAQTDSNGNVIGYQTTEASFKKELQRIQDITTKALKAADPYYNIPSEDKALILNAYSSGTSTSLLNPAKFY